MISASPVFATVILIAALVLVAALAICLPAVTVQRATTAAGAVLIAWGQVFLVFGFIAAWRLLFAPTAAIPKLPTVTPLGDYAELIKALSAAPNWISLTATGSLQTAAGVILLHLGKSPPTTS